MKYLIAIIFFFMFLGCEKSSDVFSCRGIPDENQAFSYMYFKSENEGYLFGTLTHYQEMNDKDLNNPNFSPQSTNEANIYKTLDGGLNWQKVDSIYNSSFYNIATYFSNSIYILKEDTREDFKFNIIQFNLQNSQVRKSKDIKPLSAIWNTDLGIVFSNSRGKINLYLSDKELNVLDTISVKNYPITAVNKDNIFYNICRKDGSTSLVVVKDKIEEEVELTIRPQCLISQKSNEIIIGGNKKNDDNQIDLLTYNVVTKKAAVIKEFKGYSIIQGLQSNDKVIAGFIGNISGAFTKYDLFYSLDKGKTWHIKKLEEASYIRPSCLIGSVMYIYSGGARMQKIIFER